MNRLATSLPLLDRISDFVQYYAERTPDAEALVLGDERLNYKAFSEKVDHVAKVFLAAGVRHGDRVATLSTPCPDYFVVFLAASSIGAIWLGLNPKYQLDEYRYILGDSGPLLLLARTKIGNRDYRHDLQDLSINIPSLRQLVVLCGDPPCNDAVGFELFLESGVNVTDEELERARQAVQPNDPALIVYTSGSTGKPKGAVLSHRGLVRCSIMQVSYWGCDPLRLVNYLPINHIGCVGDLSCFCLVGGGTMIFQEQFDAGRLLKIVEDEKITFLGGVPTALQMMLSVPDFDIFDLSSVQIVIWSGAPAPKSLVTQLLNVFPLASASYGLTETVGAITFAGPTRDVNLLADTAGEPVPEYEIRIVKSDGAIAVPGEEGEIQVRGDFIMNCYWRQPDATARAINKDGWFRTGDLAVESDETTYKIVGRLTEMFISGGYNIFPREIEQVIEQHPAIALATVVPVPDDLYGEVGIAFALPESNITVTEEELATFCRKRLANYKVPKRILIEKELPMLPIGKIDKSSLKKRIVEDIYPK